MSITKDPRVSLVGAGPGSSDLITLRGYRTLEDADIILYDALLSTDLLKDLNPDIPKIYVGKRCDEHSLTQEDINKLIVEEAFNYGHVVRLKGGDPYVFGRASEELEYVESFGIPVTVVPGVTSAIAVPAGQGIPVTRRGISSSFWVMTATKRDGSFSEDLELAAKSSATMVILMGVRRFLEIADKIVQHRNGLTPFAIIQNGTIENESCITGLLKDASLLVDQIDITQPGIIVVGEVVAEHPSFFEEEIQRALNH
ncbi:uroporphyrinogen-III C-methyltransferase [Arenibacter sp. M-2]|uniref:uroporphyrinogen-III C-methyltransferase n=1 Tax=Arenibacter sp. M-2 TaxID=3053612 RepID=UPI00257078DC|nr:uroporphyrinogen-III C-methyltransferase [Arenibacter sp. M-2]MDL5512253.1 uroporphyrinogen-III C-methyltransferase [Arenibacter sp. M-2]|tara:strand:- start:12 stop:779 length:768 start_codon:yes stop_codon:yes gene_type:complete